MENWYSSAPRASVAGFVRLVSEDTGKNGYWKFTPTSTTRRRVRAIANRAYVDRLMAAVRAAHRPMPQPRLCMTQAEVDAWVFSEGTRLDAEYRRAPDPVTGYVGALFGIDIYCADQPEDIVFEEAA